MELADANCATEGSISVFAFTSKTDLTMSSFTLVDKKKELIKLGDSKGKVLQLDYRIKVVRC